MPATSKAQFRAMQAAAHGHSTLGIPATVGKDFVAATPSAKGLPEKRPGNADGPGATAAPSTVGALTPSAPSTTSSNGPSSMLEAMTGMKTGGRPVRRGRHTATSVANKAKAMLDRVTGAHSKLNAAMKQGDHAASKQHALALVNALHRKSQKDEREARDNPMEDRAEPQLL